MPSFPFHEAVKSNDIPKIRLLIEDESIDVNQEDENGVTSLIEACILGNIEIINLLINEAKCPVQPAEPFQHTPLRGATVCGHYNVIPILLQAGANINSKSNGKRTPLMGACFLRNTVIDNHAEISVKCVKALLTPYVANKYRDIDLLAKNDFGESALDLAKLRGCEESVQLLEESIQIQKQGK